MRQCDYENMRLWKRQKWNPANGTDGKWKMYDGKCTRLANASLGRNGKSINKLKFQIANCKKTNKFQSLNTKSWNEKWQIPQTGQTAKCIEFAIGQLSLSYYSRVQPFRMKWNLSYDLDRFFACACRTSPRWLTII